MHPLQDSYRSMSFDPRMKVYALCILCCIHGTLLRLVSLHVGFTVFYHVQVKRTCAFLSGCHLHRTIPSKTVNNEKIHTTYDLPETNPLWGVVKPLDYIYT